MATQTRRRDSSGHVDPFAKRRQRYQALLRPLGLWEEFVRLPRTIQEQMFQFKYPDPQLVFDASFPEDGEYGVLRETLQEAFRTAKMRIENAMVDVRDYYAIILSFADVLRASQNAPNLPETTRSFMRDNVVFFEHWRDKHFQDSWMALYHAVVLPLVARSRLNRRLMVADLKNAPNEHGKTAIRMTITSEVPEERRVWLDGHPRPMMRVGTSNEWGKVGWVSWDSTKYDRLPPGQEYAVYVQSHALRNLHERVNLTRIEQWLEYWLYASLANPNIVDRQGEDLLVEYRIQQTRFGYLVVTPVKDQGLIAVRTFLFLTMQGTPEAKLLKDRLDLKRRDIDKLGLYELAAFTQTDLKDDAELRELLERCGCGHLFDLEEEDYSPVPKPFAAEMKKYLQLAA